MFHVKHSAQYVSHLLLMGKTKGNDKMENAIKEICLKCEHNIHCQNKCCAFRSLGNEYCDEVNNANNLIIDLQQKIDKAIEYINSQKYEYDDGEISGVDCCCDGFKLLEILGGK